MQRDSKRLGCNDPNRHDRFDRFFDGQLGRERFFLREKEEKPLGRNKGRGNKNGHLRFALQVGQLICHKPEHVVSFLWKLNEYGLTEGALFCGGEGIGQLFGGGIDVFNNRDRGEETIPPSDQLAAQDIGGNQSDQIEQDEETDEPYPREVVQTMEERDVDIGNQGVKDAIQGVEDKFQNKKGDPDGQYD